MRCRSSNDLNHFNNTVMEAAQCAGKDACSRGSTPPCKPPAAAPATACTPICIETKKCVRLSLASPAPRSLFGKRIAVPPSPTGSTCSTVCLSDDDRSRESSLELEVPVKKVSFFPMVSLVLIPTRHELSRAQKDSMWWSSEEIQEFRWECYLNSKRVENQARISKAIAAAAAAATSATPCTSGVVLTARRRASVPLAAAATAAAASTKTAASTKCVLPDVERAPCAIVGAKLWQQGRVCV